MKKNNTPPADPTAQRRQAEERLKKKQRSQRSEEGVPRAAKTQSLIQELQIHQIELEMQNEELQRTRSELEALLNQYTDLYDFAPVGYFTLDRDGAIRRVNLPGARLLGVERARLVNRYLGLFVSEADRPTFNAFLQKAFGNRQAVSDKATCEVALCNPDDRPHSLASSGGRHAAGAPRGYVHIEAQASVDGLACRAVVSDITENRKMHEFRDFLARFGGPSGGEGFFESLARCLAENLNMDFICVDRIEGDGLTARTVAVWCDGKFEDNLSYALKDTPCGEVVGKAVCCFPASVCQFFPRDQVLRDLQAESYVGVTLWGHTGQPIGLIAVIGRRPLVNRRLAEDMLQLVAVRAAGEMERLDAEEKIKASLLEKETMLKEIHHRVKNNLQVVSSLLGLQSSHLQDEQSRKIFQESQDRVRVMANIHTLLYQSGDLAKVDFGGFIRDLVGRLQQSYGTAGPSVEVHVDIADVSLTIETSIPCGLILNELVSNALKHAFPGGRGGEVHINIVDAGDQFVLKVQDDGIGFPASIDFRETQSLGLELVNLLVGQINGTIDLQVEGGTTFTIQVPAVSK